MGKTFFMAGIVGLALLGDVVLPPLFGFWAVSVLPAVLVFFLLQYGTGDRVIMGGAFLAFLAELLRGAPIGSLMSSFLAVALLFILAGRFIQVTPLAISGRFGGLQLAGVIVWTGALLVSFWLFFSLFEIVVSGTDVPWQQTLALTLRWRLLVPSLGLTLIILAAARAFERA